MIIDCISDLHGHYPKLEGGDLLIVGGDWTARDSEEDLRRFEDWLLSEGSSQYKKIIVIAGNHDNTAYEFRQFALTPYLQSLPNVTYLCDSGTEFEDLKIWGSPWTKTFEGINHHCCAFTVDAEEALAEKWQLIPDDTDILVTHSPPCGYFDSVNNIPKGSHSLLKKCYGSKGFFPFMHIFGHIHEEGGGIIELGGQLWPNQYNCLLINASHVNERYQPINKPIKIFIR